MVITRRARSRWVLAVALVALALEFGGSTGCLINPKDYPLAPESAAGEAGERSSAGGDGRVGAGGSLGAGGRGGASNAGGADTGGTRAAGGMTSVGHGGATDTGEAGAAPSDLGGEAGVAAEGGSSGDSTGGTSFPSAGATAAGSAGQSGAGGMPSTSRKRVFVTSQTFDGNFRALGDTSDANGLKGADTACNDAASKAGLGGMWIAWLSVTGGDAINRVADVAPWYLVDQVTKVFDTHSQLGAPADVPVNMTENRNTVTGPAWTGTTLLGTAHSARCGEWKNNGTSLGAWGDVGNAFDWSYKDTQYCSKEARLYCLEQ